MSFLFEICFARVLTQNSKGLHYKAAMLMKTTACKFGRETDVEVERCQPKKNTEQEPK